jgi:DNA-binding NtrC family response regulator
MALCEYFLEIYRERYSSKDIRLSNPAIAKLRRYPFTGNREELVRILEKAVVLSDFGEIRPEDIRTTPLPKRKKHSQITLEESEKRLISKALDKTGNNFTETSHMLGISRKTLYNKVKRYSL